MQREGGGNAPPATGSDSVDFTVDSSHLNRPTRVLKAHKRKRLSNHQITKPFISRGDWIRTSDHTPPRIKFYFFR